MIMIKNTFISVISQEAKQKKKKKKGSVEFQVLSFTNKIRRLTSHLELRKKTFYLREVYGKLWENGRGCWLICQKKIEYVIKN